MLFDLVFHWCVSIRILMTRVYINPVFSRFGTANLLLPAKPCPCGKRFFPWEVFCCSSTVLFRTNSSACCSLTVLLRTNSSASVTTVLLGTRSSVFGSTVLFRTTLFVFVLTRISCPVFLPSLQFYFPGNVLFFPDFKEIAFQLSLTLGAFHLVKISGIFGSAVNGTRFVGSSHWKIPRKSGKSKKVVPFSRLEFPNGMSSVSYTHLTLPTIYSV